MSPAERPARLWPLERLPAGAVACWPGGRGGVVLVLAVTAKGGRRRLVPLAPRTAHAIAEHLAGRPGGPLLVANDGRRLTRQQAARIVARLARRAGIAKRISPHSLRHTAITLALDGGASLRSVQASAGHADPKTTVRYDRARRGLDDHITYRLAQYLADSRSTP